MGTAGNVLNVILGRKSRKRRVKSYSIMELPCYDRERHISVEEAYALIDSQNDPLLKVEKLKSAIVEGTIRIYDEFGKKKYLDRMDIGRVYHAEPDKKDGLVIGRFYSRKDLDPLDAIRDFEKRDVRITTRGGKVIFELKNALFPESWSDNDASIVAQKYFYKPHKEEWKRRLRENEQVGRETEFSPVHMFRRVTNFIADEGERLNYFKSKRDKKAFVDELNWMQIHRMFAFNSPVYFNAGLYNEYGVEGSPGASYWKDPDTEEVIRIKKGGNIKPTCHACFIKGPRDDLESLMKQAKDECNIFSCGSGIGHDMSGIRGENEPLSGGGVASGPLSFEKIYDDEAATIKSGGKSRRAARMLTLRGGGKECHPDIMKFIRAKVGEDKKALALMKKGWASGMDGEAYATVTYQNTNFSVRLDEEFFREIERDGEIELKRVTDGKITDKNSARRILKEISYGTWRVGDPGVQYESKIQEMHTCKNSGRINSSNPCSEYMFLDNTSCNLGSLNLLAFSDEKGNFQVEKFKEGCRIATIALDIINNAASYPVEEIAAISPEFRSIGLGYSNLGSLLMRKCLPYDSEKGRNYAAAITALMTGAAYETSTEMAEKLGAFEHFELNRKPMIEVIRKHRKNLEKIAWNDMPEDLRKETERCWESAEKRGERFGFRNAQVSLIAPTGTVSYIMGCETTGVEPATSLRISKDLAGGGVLILENREMINTLKNLGYDGGKVEEILKFVSEKETVRGAPHINPDHYSVFDTAFGDRQGEGSIKFEGHIKMLGAVQPFLSGAISKTINFPEDATVRDVYGGYLLGNKLGLKAISAFRRNSKPISPLGFEGKNYIELKRGEKEDLPTKRPCTEFEIKLGGTPFHILASHYLDGLVGQIVILSYKAGSTLGSSFSLQGVVASKALKRGVSLEDIIGPWLNQELDPRGVVQGHKYVKTASSIFDAAAKILLLEFMNRKELANVPEGTEPEDLEKVVKDEDLEGYYNGAFRTYERMKVDAWNVDQVLADPEYGGFERGKTKLYAGKKSFQGSGGMPCRECGRIMDQIGPNCYICRKCPGNVGTCAG